MTDEELIQSQIQTLGETIDTLLGAWVSATPGHAAVRVRRKAAGNVARALHNLMRAESRIHAEGLSSEISAIPDKVSDSVRP